MEIIGKDSMDDRLIVKMTRDEVLLYKKMFGVVQKLFNDASGCADKPMAEKPKKSRKARTKKADPDPEPDPKNLPDLDKGSDFYGKGKK